MLEFQSNNVIYYPTIHNNEKFKKIMPTLKFTHDKIIENTTRVASSKCARGKKISERRQKKKNKVPGKVCFRTPFFKSIYLVASFFFFCSNLFVHLLLYNMCSKQAIGHFVYPKSVMFVFFFFTYTQHYIIREREATELSLMARIYYAHRHIDKEIGFLTKETHRL